ncbi:hypothetical protein [Aquiflexum lacus]|uniref:hypothetical protein n=1 Tax=Aquiflexum lacus TaxID=2483805 RepID=UPI00189597BC|nr:hypothetical protein [Aquiflexum lacus]
MKTNFLRLTALFIILIISNSCQEEILDSQTTEMEQEIESLSDALTGINANARLLDVCPTVDEDRFISLSHLHNQARITTKGVTNFADQLYTASGGSIVNAGPLRFTSSGDKVEIGGGEGFGVTTPTIDFNTSKKKFINNNETLVIQTVGTTDQIIKASLTFRGTGDPDDLVVVKASRGNKCLGETIVDLSSSNSVELCFSESFTKLEITAGPNTNGVQLAQGTKFFVGAFAINEYQLCSDEISWVQGALNRQNQNFPGETVSTEVCWHIEYKNNDCNNSGSVNRYYLRRKDTGEVLAGVAGNNQLREPNRIFAYQKGGNNTAWGLNVPFVLLRKYHAGNYRPAIATPNFTFGYPNKLNQFTFISPTNGVSTWTDSETGDIWEARQGDKNGGNLARVYIYKNGSQVQRTNGAGENGSLQGFAVLTVRTAIVDNSGKIENVYDKVAFALIQHYNKGLTLQTRIGDGWYMAPIQQQIVF